MTVGQLRKMLSDADYTDDEKLRIGTFDGHTFPVSAIEWREMRVPGRGGDPELVHTCLVLIPSRT
jgi:hypothetical protein